MIQVKNQLKNNLKMIKIKSLKNKKLKLNKDRFLI